jgi:hypothetical protein
LYSSRPVGRAIIWTILGGYLLLPVGASIKIEGIPPFDKVSIPIVAALIGCLLVARNKVRLWNRFGLAEVLILILLISPFITSELNGDAIAIGRIVLPGVGYYDALSASVRQFIFLLPFILGRQFLGSSADNGDILRILAIAGLAYSLPVLFEIRMSPQLHTWIYGYFPQEFGFVQQIRWGGFRPVVFLGHGLLVAFFVMTTAVAAAALWRTQTRIVRLAPAGVTAYLSVVLVLCKTLGALTYGIFLVPLVRWANPHLQVRVAAVLVIVVLAYPMLRATNVFPTTLMVDTISAMDTDRAASLKSRFDQEAELLVHASKRIWFGWGRWGRSRVHDSETGQDVSITDGRWIITMGSFGLIGFLAEFGLLVLPVFRAAAALKYAESTHDRIFLAALTIIVAINSVDLLPNSSISSWTWLLAGALLGRAELLGTLAQQGKLAWRPKRNEMTSRAVRH